MGDEVRAGWLDRKWKSGWGKRSWLRVWAVLKGSFLYIYEGKPTDGVLHKEMVSLKDATVQILLHHTRKWCFEVIHDERRPVCFEAADDEEKVSHVRRSSFKRHA